MSFSRYLSKLGQLLNSSGQVLPSGLATGTDFTIAGLTVGKGGGGVSTNTAVGASALAVNTTGAYNTALGANSLAANTTGNGLTALGNTTLYVNTTGSENTAIGGSSATYAALRFNTTGSNNVAVGGGALASNTVSSANSAVGYQSGYYSQAGAGTVGNVYFGYQAGYGDASGYYNTYLGSLAGPNTVTNANGPQNTGVGRQALTALTTGNSNTAVGFQSGFSNTTGSNNQLFGMQAGYALTTGSSNFFAGYGAGGAITTGSKNSVIGNYNGNQGGLDIRTADNNIVLSDGDGSPRLRIDSSGAAYFDAYSTANGGTRIYGPSTTSSPRIEVLHQSGSGSGGSFVAFWYNGATIGSITQSGTTAVAYNTTSDYRLKENVQPLSGALERVAALKPCTYTWKSAPDEIGEGFLAHELAEVCPLAVTGEKDAVNEDGSIKPQSIDTSFLVATLTAAIQELNTKLEAQAAEINQLKGN